MEILIVIGVGIAIMCLVIFIISVFRMNMEKDFTKIGNSIVRAQNNIINNNEDILRENANKMADINKDSVKIMAHSIKEGFSTENTVYCKHCGQLIDGDSKFCKSCGKEQ